MRSKGMRKNAKSAWRTAPARAGVCGHAETRLRDASAAFARRRCWDGQTRRKGEAYGSMKDIVLITLDPTSTPLNLRLPKHK